MTTLSKTTVVLLILNHTATSSLDMQLLDSFSDTAANAELENHVESYSVR